MRRDEAIRRLHEHRAELRGLGVRHLFLFGSTASDSATDTSDIDLFFDYDKGHFGLFALMDVKQRAADILGCRIDIMPRDSLHQTLCPAIEASAVRIF